MAQRRWVTDDLHSLLKNPGRHRCEFASFGARWHSALWSVEPNANQNTIICAAKTSTGAVVHHAPVSIKLHKHMLFTRNHAHSCV